ncbi:tyrosine-type recombinase/integrase [Vibrio apostichopi]|uniref:tyrosine-type recombinase/integrase n=1 Tax=Vibrio apostichopi TaxID=3035453 RepID=UPI00257352EF|nr:site-specific integrase [Vibrio sp. FE10]
MKRILSRDVEFEDRKIETLHSFYDDNLDPILLPNLWLLHLSLNQAVYGWRKTGTKRRSQRTPKNVEIAFTQNDISENTAHNYVGHVFKLLNHINDKPQINVHYTEQLTSRFINDYLNNVLPERLDSIASVKAHQAGIAAYCNFLCALGIWPLEQNRPTTIYRKTRQYMADKDTRPRKINYITSDEYSDLLRTCTSKRDKLILAMGYEVGLRASENIGLELNDNGKHKGLRPLFEELESTPSKMQFEYILRAKYTKGSKTGAIYFDRELLQQMKDYHDGERAAVVEKSGVDAPTLFIRYDHDGRGQSISVEHASNMFKNIKEKLSYLNQSLSYHDLRHSFATILYHEELLDSNGQETRSESAALETVRKRLRHAEGSKTVHRYIRLRTVMLSRETGAAA